MRQKIVAADDSSAVRMLYGLELEEEGYEVLLAATGREAIRLVREESPQLAILDLRMPDMDGLETMARILEIDNELPVIIHSAYPSYMDSFLSWSADAFVLKSSDLGELKETVRRLLEHHGRGADSHKMDFAAAHAAV